MGLTNPTNNKRGPALFKPHIVIQQIANIITRIRFNA